MDATTTVEQPAKPVERNYALSKYLVLSSFLCLIVGVTLGWLISLATRPVVPPAAPVESVELTAENVSEWLQDHQNPFFALTGQLLGMRSVGLSLDGNSLANICPELADIQVLEVSEITYKDPSDPSTGEAISGGELVVYPSNAQGEVTLRTDENTNRDFSVTAIYKCKPDGKTGVAGGSGTAVILQKDSEGHWTVSGVVSGY